MWRSFWGQGVETWFDHGEEKEKNMAEGAVPQGFLHISGAVSYIVKDLGMISNIGGETGGAGAGRCPEAST